MADAVHECHLEVSVEEHSPCECDGCGRDIPVGEAYIWNITSCCGGGCARSLCRECVAAAAKLLEESDG